MKASLTFLHTSTLTFWNWSGLLHHLSTCCNKLKWKTNSDDLTSAFMKVMIMTWQTEGAQNTAVIRITFHCQAPMYPSLASIWSSSTVDILDQLWQQEIILRCVSFSCEMMWCVLCYVTMTINISAKQEMEELLVAIIILKKHVLTCHHQL